MTEAFITLATNDQYAIGAMTLAASLKCVQTTKQIIIMITDTVSVKMREVMQKLFNEVILVNVLNSDDPMNLELLKRPDLGITFTKLHCWRLMQFTKGIFMDADTLVLANIDELFEREELSAAPDIGWPDCFNSGVFVFRPNCETYRKLLLFSLDHKSFDGADQGLLNLYFSNWSKGSLDFHLPFVYNCAISTYYSFNPALNYFKENIKVIHFIGPVKPWHYDFNSEVGQVSLPDNNGVNSNYLQTWWSIFMEHVFPLISPELASFTDGYLLDKFEHIFRM